MRNVSYLHMGIRGVNEYLQPSRQVPEGSRREGHIFETLPPGFLLEGALLDHEGTRVGPREAVWGNEGEARAPHGLPRAHTGPRGSNRAPESKKPGGSGFEKDPHNGEPKGWLGGL